MNIEHMKLCIGVILSTDAGTCLLDSKLKVAYNSCLFCFASKYEYGMLNCFGLKLDRECMR